MSCSKRIWVQGIQKHANYVVLFFNLERLTLILLQINIMHKVMELL